MTYYRGDKKNGELICKEPIQLAYFKEGKWNANNHALELLCTIKTDLYVVGIIGNYRKGKSYLMNRILNQKSGFALGDELTGCTHGIWMQGERIKDKTLICLDTEGLEDACPEDND